MLHLCPRAALVCAALVLAAACGTTGSGTRPAPVPWEDRGLIRPDEGEVAGGEELSRRRVARAEELLEGRFPGVQLIRLAGGGFSVRIRGVTSIHGSNEPLFVVDGMPVHGPPGGALLGINPHDIERIQVLKDIASTAAYGMRGANGVILITTRRPGS
ncbi:MAG TPA: TonB-dependent receptor plug domain-containing protein [Longimicrobium sp.]|nr:TonB-dependent receptor plug domain-containing protein [Longimicrobium sp.]